MPLDGASGKVIQQEMIARIKSGMTVVPMIHAKKGGTWKGAAFTAK